MIDLLVANVSPYVLNKVILELDMNMPITQFTMKMDKQFEGCSLQEVAAQTQHFHPENQILGHRCYHHTYPP